MSTAALEYAPLPRGHRSRSARRIVFGSVLGVALLAGTYFWPTIKSLGARWYSERRCLNHQDPAGTIFYSNDPQDQPKLSATSGYETTWSMWPKGQYVIRPNRWAEQLSSARSGRSGSWPRIAPTLFVHGRNAPSGPRVLVFVQAWRMADDPQSRLSFTPTVTGTSGTSANIAKTAPGGLDMCLMPTDLVRVYCGQPDANDASHFTIDYDLNGVRGTIDGNLAGSGVVTLRPRTGRTVVSGAMCCWSPSGAPMPVWAQEIEAATTQPGR